MERVKTDAKNGTTTRAQRGTFLHHGIQNVFQVVLYLQILELHVFDCGSDGYGICRLRRD